MKDKEMIEIRNINGSIIRAEVITYLISEDGFRNYVVYSKGEVQGIDQDHVIYISRILKDEEGLKLEEINDDTEWLEVQHLLKKIANAR